ncbi:MAG: chemotaxis protein CheB [Gemmatimonadaceae bacterium]|nr:chemotaxis protein CheB [Gemmatimonadaceae bacterium]
MTDGDQIIEHDGQLRFPVVGIGASAGGLSALRAFFDAVPDKCGMAFVVIVHLDPNHKSHMAELLQAHTPMRVRQVTKATKLQPDQVYIIPPDKDLTLADGHFRLAARAQPNRSRAPIDGFFKTLAESHSADAVGIVLSGTGSDGAQGIRWIKERGGVTMAQSPDEAEHSAMPESAVATGQVDIVLPVAQLGAEAMRLCRSDKIESSAADSPAAKRDDAVVREILALVRVSTDHDFSGYKRSTIDRRIRRRAQFAHAANLADYLRLISADRKALLALYDDLLIAVTSFFRDPDAFASLEREVVPRLFENRDSSDTIRVWVTGCATGEEAYSIAILLCEHAEGLADPPPIQVFATDVHERAFAFAREGLYPESIAADVSDARLGRFFTHEPGGYRVRKIVREKVVYATHNLLRDPPFLRLDLITCRNLLIYLQRDAQRRALELFHFALRPGGNLFLGTSESIEDASKTFAVVDKKYRIFRSLDVPQTSLPRLVQAALGDPGAERRQSDRLANVTHFGAVHRRLLEAYAPPSLVVNGDGEIVHLSDGVGRFLQLGGGEPTRKLLDLVSGSVRPKLRTLLSRALSAGERAETRGLAITVDGRKRIVDVIARPVRGSASADSFALIVFDEQDDASHEPADVPGTPKLRTRGTDAVRELERELEETRSQLNVTLEEHETATEELKASNEELQSINEEQRATDEELEASREELQSMNEELQTINQEYRSKNEELGQVNADLVNLIDSTEIGTIFLDRTLRLRRFTPAVSSLFNVLQSDVGRPLADLTHRLLYPAMLDEAREVMRTLLRVESEVRSGDGRWFTVRISPYRSLDDRIEGIVMTLVNTTDRKAAEVERERLLNEVQAASVAKSNFIGVMSHELRTPLNAIIGYADILAAGAVGPVTAEQAAHLDRVKASAIHLAHMIDDSLQSVRIEAGVATLDNESVDVAALVREVAIVTEPLMTAKKLRFEVRAEDGPPIFADATKIRQILFNLLGNAVRYTDRGEVSISSRVSDHGATITIEDSGIGISAEHLEKIFERFWQVDQSRTRVRGGAGLGLMVSRSLARVLGGDLYVTSELGRGSRFVLRLPKGEATGNG